MSRPRVMGMTCGIGSMLIGARAAKFAVKGNVEWRKYYHTGTFEHNFAGAFLVHHLSDLDKQQLASIDGIDLVMGHPECGNFSNLNTSKRVRDLRKDAADIPLFVESVASIRPRFFVMDDLPLSLEAFPIDEYHQLLPDYDLYWEWVSNYHYGNVQFHRRRFFVIGALKTEGFVFRSGEFDNDRTTYDVTWDLSEKDILAMNHVHKRPGETIPAGWRAHQLGLRRKDNMVTYGDMMKHITDWPVGRNFPYTNKRGESKLRPGYCKIRLDRPAPVMSGGGSAIHNHYRADTLLPLTQRERARIQGCPDDFVFLPVNPAGHEDEQKVYKQIGKFMPVQFCTFVSGLIYHHIKNHICTKASIGVTDRRLAKPNPIIDRAKQDYCLRFGYSRQKDVCEACWMTESCDVLKKKRRRGRTD